MFDTPLTKGRQALQGHAEGNQCFISDLNFFRFSISLKILGGNSQILGSRKDNESFPLRSVLTFEFCSTSGAIQRKDGI